MTALTSLETDRVAALDAAEAAGRVDDAFLARFDVQFPRLHGFFAELYGARPDGQQQLAETVAAASTAWNTRPLELKVRDAQREAEPGWFESERMLGGVCYVDRYAGNLEGIREQIPYFRELGLTYLHLMPLFDAPEGDNDGGYAVSSYRRVNPSLGTMAQLTELAADLRTAGISLPYGVAVAVFGGLSPLVATALLDAGRFHFFLAGVVVLCLASAVVYWRMPETKDLPL